MQVKKEGLQICIPRAKIVQMVWPLSKAKKTTKVVISYKKKKLVNDRKSKSQISMRTMSYNIDTWVRIYLGRNFETIQNLTQWSQILPFVVCKCSK